MNRSLGLIRNIGLASTVVVVAAGLASTATAAVSAFSTLLGSAGLEVVFQDASSYPTHAGSGDLTPTLPLVQEVAQTGAFERVLSWGIGLNRSACIRALELSNPARLVIDVQTPQAAG